MLNRTFYLYLEHIMSDQPSSLSDWKKIIAFVRDNPQFSEQQIRWALRNRDFNGLNKANAVKRFGRPLYIHENRFAQWFEEYLG